MLWNVWSRCLFYPSLLNHYLNQHFFLNQHIYWNFSSSMEYSACNEGTKCSGPDKNARWQITIAMRKQILPPSCDWNTFLYVSHASPFCLVVMFLMSPIFLWSTSTKSSIQKASKIPVMSFLP